MYRAAGCSNIARAAKRTCTHDGGNFVLCVCVCRCVSTCQLVLNLPIHSASEMRTACHMNLCVCACVCVCVHACVRTACHSHSQCGRAYRYLPQHALKRF